MKYHYRPKPRAEERAEAAWDMIVDVVVFIVVSWTTYALVVAWQSV